MIGARSPITLAVSAHQNVTYNVGCRSPITLAVSAHQNVTYNVGCESPNSSRHAWPTGTAEPDSKNWRIPNKIFKISHEARSLMTRYLSAAIKCGKLHSLQHRIQTEHLLNGTLRLPSRQGAILAPNSRLASGNGLYA